VADKKLVFADNATGLVVTILDGEKRVQARDHDNEKQVALTDMEYYKLLRYAIKVQAVLEGVQNRISEEVKQTQQ
jgi:very-short-patch-repair endonuclease